MTTQPVLDLLDRITREARTAANTALHWQAEVERITALIAMRQAAGWPRENIAADRAALDRATRKVAAAETVRDARTALIDALNELLDLHDGVAR